MCQYTDSLQGAHTIKEMDTKLDQKEDTTSTTGKKTVLLDGVDLGKVLTNTIAEELLKLKSRSQSCFRKPIMNVLTKK